MSYRTDCLADWADPESGLIASADIDAVTRKSPMVMSPRRDLGVIYAAAIDPAARMNAWTMVVKHRQKGVDVIDLAKQWHRPPGGSALDPNAVLAEMSALLGPYGVKHVATDKWQVDALKALARHHGLELIDYDYGAQELTELYLDMATRIQQQLIELPPDAQIRGDLLGARRRVTSSGMFIDLAVGAGGRHSDYVPAIARVLRQHTPDCEPHEKPPVDNEKRLVELAKGKFMQAKKPRRGEHWWQKTT